MKMFKPIGESVWEKTDSVIKELFPNAPKDKETFEGVSFNYINSGSSTFYSSFGGIGLNIMDNKYHHINRRIFVNKDGEIDLDKVKEKFEELKALYVIENQKLKDRNEKFENDRKDLRDMVNKAKLSLDDQLTKTDTDEYYLKVYLKTEDDVYKVMDLVNSLRR